MEFTMESMSEDEAVVVGSTEVLMMVTLRLTVGVPLVTAGAVDSSGVRASTIWLVTF